MSSYHPDGLTVDIVGLIASNRGRNCDGHPFCGEIVQLDVVVRFRREMIYVAVVPMVDRGGKSRPSLCIG